MQQAYLWVDGRIVLQWILIRVGGCELELSDSGEVAGLVNATLCFELDCHGTELCEHQTVSDLLNAMM